MSNHKLDKIFQEASEQGEYLFSVDAWHGVEETLNAMDPAGVDQVFQEGAEGLNFQPGPEAWASASQSISSNLGSSFWQSGIMKLGTQFILPLATSVAIIQSDENLSASDHYIQTEIFQEEQIIDESVVASTDSTMANPWGIEETDISENETYTPYSIGAETPSTNRVKQEDLSAQVSERSAENAEVAEFNGKSSEPSNNTEILLEDKIDEASNEDVDMASADDEQIAAHTNEIDSPITEGEVREPEAQYIANTNLTDSQQITSSGNVDNKVVSASNNVTDEADEPAKVPPIDQDETEISELENEAAGLPSAVDRTGMKSIGGGEPINFSLGLGARAFFLQDAPAGHSSTYFSPNVLMRVGYRLNDLYSLEAELHFHKVVGTQGNVEFYQQTYGFGEANNYRSVQVDEAFQVEIPLRMRYRMSERQYVGLGLLYSYTFASKLNIKDSFIEWYGEENPLEYEHKGHIHGLRYWNIGLSATYQYRLSPRILGAADLSYYLLDRDEIGTHSISNIPLSLNISIKYNFGK